MPTPPSHQATSTAQQTERIISEPVIASIAANAARATPGVVRLEVGVTGLVRQLRRHTHARWVGLDPAPSAGVTVARDTPNPGATTVHLDVVVAVTGERTAVAVATVLQSAVADAVAANTGVAVSAVAVSILDIAIDVSALPE